MVETVMVGGVPIARLSHSETTDEFIRIIQKFKTGDRPYISNSANGEVIARVHADAEFKRDLFASDMINPDGMPLVWASRYLTGTPLPERVTTTDLFHVVAKRFLDTDMSFYLLGADENEIMLATNNIRKLYPGLKIVGVHHGFINDSNREALIEAINQAAPSVLWIGMGVPREQRFCLMLKERLTTVPVIKTCGGLFNYISGTRSRAPEWMQKMSLEWLYRLYLEPKRLGWRYLSTNPIAAWHLLTKTG